MQEITKYIKEDRSKQKKVCERSFDLLWNMGLDLAADQTEQQAD